MEEAKSLIDAYLQDEFQNDKGQTDYSDMTSIGVGYTTTEDGDHEIQALVNLEAFTIATLVDLVPVRTQQFSDMEDLVKNGLPNLDFDELTYVSEEEIGLSLLLGGDSSEQSSLL